MSCGLTEEGVNVVSPMPPITVDPSQNIIKQRPVGCPVAPKEFYRNAKEICPETTENNKMKSLVMSIFVNKFVSQWLINLPPCLITKSHFHSICVCFPLDSHNIILDISIHYLTNGINK
jgi:hypothetical protein